MQRVKDAIRYGVETLSVSPDRLFSLIESSRDYSGDDYPRWLANQIIKISENEGVGFSQLLVKKFDIIRDLIEEVEDESSIKEECVSFIKNLIGLEKRVFSINMEEVGENLDGIDWFSGIDYGLGARDFISKLPESLVESAQESKELNLCCRLTNAKSSQKCDLFLDAKARGISCKSEGALYLYRACMLADVLGLQGSQVTLLFTADVDFFFHSENKEILNYFLECFTINGIVVSNSDFLVNSFISGKKAICMCRSRVVDVNGLIPEMQNGISLEEGFLEGNEFKPESTKCYLAGSESMLKSIHKQEESQFGFLCINSLGSVIQLSSKQEEGMSCIPIGNKNLGNIIVYFGVVKSLEQFGMSRDIPTIADGHPKFEELLYNCLPLFLFDSDSKLTMKDILEQGRLMAEHGEVFFSFEAKELFTICNDYLNHLKGLGEDIDGLCFKEISGKFYDDDLNEMYMQSLVRLKDQICSLYRSISN